jgi:hypothetical protein
LKKQETDRHHQSEHRRHDNYGSQIFFYYIGDFHSDLPHCLIITANEINVKRAAAARKINLGGGGAAVDITAFM